MERRIEIETQTVSALTAARDTTRYPGRRSDLEEDQLFHWIRTVRTLLARTDDLLERLERLNLRGDLRPPPYMEQAALEFLEGMGVDVAERTVQALLDGLFKGQEPILAELRACRREQERRAQYW